jgi:large exoprotein involved in heme utilization and adhesion
VGCSLSSSTISSNIGRYGEGKTGKISIDGTGKLTLNKSKIESAIAGGTGDSQGINIKANQLNLLDSGIYSQTAGRGNAGDIQIDTKGDTILSKSLIYSSSSSFDFSPTATPLSLFFPVPDLKGNKYSAGNIDISSRGLLIDNGDIISASEIGQGGNIKIMTNDKLLLRGNNGFFSTIASDSGVNNKTVVSGDNQNGGSIYIGKSINGDSNSVSFTGTGLNTFFFSQKRSRDAVIKNNNNPSTSFLSGNGNGGNITISSPLIVALPGNNDITANAYQGNGGKVKIDSQGLFGIQYRPVGSLFTNDITASSTFGQSGNVQVNTPGTDPGKNKGELAATPNDASNQISQACGASQRENKFYITGRGGLPPTARDPLESEAVWQDARAVTTKPAPTANQIQNFPQPAIGWRLDKNGRVNLIAAQTGAGAAGTRVVCPNR